MNKTINAKELRASLPRIVERLRRGERFTVLYRSRPAFRIVPPDEAQHASGSFRDDSLYRAGAVGRSTDGLSATDHDTALYGGK